MSDDGDQYLTMRDGRNQDLTMNDGQEQYLTHVITLHHYSVQMHAVALHSSQLTN